MTKVFISGGSGTTGLRIVERLSARADIELVSLPEELRKDPAAQAELAEQADITFLCLPDDASRALIAALGDTKGRVLDTSTAFRTDARFAYGFPELSPAHEAAVKQANRVAVPGCHASGAIALSLQQMNPESRADRALEFTLDGKRFFVIHGNFAEPLNRVLASGDYDYILRGHSHLFEDLRVGRTRLINPGALGDWLKPHSFAVLDVEEDLLIPYELKE